MQREDTQLYQELGIDPTKQNVLLLSEKDIASAYRKAALQWHPDKNRGNPNASEKFSRVFLAYETLSSVSKRKEYDDKIRLTRQRHQAFMQQDATRRKMRQQLEQREFRAAQTASKQSIRTRASGFNDDDAFARIQREVERLRKQAMQEHENDQTRPMQSDNHVSERQTGVPARPLHSTREQISSKYSLRAGPWADVSGFSAFRSKSIGIQFDEFERAVLNGESPFEQNFGESTTNHTREMSKKP